MWLRRGLLAVAGAVVSTLAAGALGAGPAGAASSSADRPLDTAPTTTTLTLSPSDVFFGVELARATVQVSGGDGSPAGDFGVFAGSVLLCSGTLANGQGTCILPDRSLLPGSYTFTAVYDGDQNSGSSAGTALLRVSPLPTMTRVTLSADSVAVGLEDSETLTVQVSSSIAVGPAGTVTIAAGGHPLCTGLTLLLETGTADCTMTPSQLPVGTYQVTAHFDGQPGFGSSDSPAQTLTVSKRPSSTALTLSAPEATFGREQAELLTVDVTGPLGTPSGMVTIKDNGTAIATLGLVAGTATKTLAATQLKPGTRKLTATYNGDATYARSASGPATLTIAAEPASTALTLSAARVKAGHEQSEKLTVQVRPKFTGPAPAGKVTITTGSTRICTITLAKGKGSCTLRPSQLRPGKHTLTATYPATSPYTGSASPKKTLTVTR